MRRSDSRPTQVRGQDEHVVEQNLTQKVVAMQKALETVHVDPAILSYIIEIVQRTLKTTVNNGACLRQPSALFKTGRAGARWPDATM